MKEKTFEKKNELLEAALVEFTNKRYEDASLNLIIKNANISKGTFYYHFKDKEALYLYILESAINKKWDFMKKKMEDNPSVFKELDIFESFKRQSELGVQFAAEYPEYYRLGIMFTKEKGNKIYDTAMRIMGNTTENLLEQMIAVAIERGDFKSRFSKDFIVKIICYMFVHFDEIFNVVSEDIDLNKMVENLNDYVDFLKGGLGS